MLIFNLYQRYVFKLALFPIYIFFVRLCHTLRLPLKINDMKILMYNQELCAII